jgi:hypothetical protein
METYKEQYLKIIEKTLPYGKYKGMTIKEVLNLNPAYLLWFKSNCNHPISNDLTVIHGDIDWRHGESVGDGGTFTERGLDAYNEGCLDSRIDN